MEKIETAQDPIDIHTNAGIKQVKESCQVEKSYYAKYAMKNIIGLADMRKKFRNTYDSDKEAAFLVHTPSKIIEFPELSEGIYALDMEHKDKKYKYKMIKNKKDKYL